MKGLVLGSQESRCYYRCAGEGLCLAYSIFLSMYSLSCSVATPILVPAGSINIRPGLRTVRPSKSGLHCKDTVVELPASKRFSVWRRRVCTHTDTPNVFLRQGAGCARRCQRIFSRVCNYLGIPTLSRVRDEQRHHRCVTLLPWGSLSACHSSAITIFSTLSCTRFAD